MVLLSPGFVSLEPFWKSKPVLLSNVKVAVRGIEHCNNFRNEAITVSRFKRVHPLWAFPKLFFKTPFLEKRERSSFSEMWVLRFNASLASPLRTPGRKARMMSMFRMRTCWQQGFGRFGRNLGLRTLPSGAGFCHQPDVPSNQKDRYTVWVWIQQFFSHVSKKTTYLACSYTVASADCRTSSGSKSKMSPNTHPSTRHQRNRNELHWTIELLLVSRNQSLHSFAHRYMYNLLRYI